MTLADRIAHVLAGNGRPMTGREIARELRVRLADVLAALAEDGRFCRWPDSRRKLYQLHADKFAPLDATGAPEQSGTPLEAA